MLIYISLSISTNTGRWHDAYMHCYINNQSDNISSGWRLHVKKHLSL